MASPNTAGQNKRKSSDGLTSIVPPTSVRPRISPFDGLIMDSTPPAESESSSARNPLPYHAEAESSSARNPLPYHVFISHHGQDTKHTLASSIYNELDATGLRVFLDKDELKLGDFFPTVLENAIASASVHIVIFSKNYVQSPWCMAELSFMLTLETKVTFIPIFYHVEPSTLRWAIEGKGIYANAFDEYEKKNRYTQELQSWKWALHRASLYTGEIISKQCDEAEVITKVVKDILKELKMMRLDVALHPVGLDEREQDFHNTALQNSRPIQIVGIWGMGGAGKTTLAKHLYNKKKKCSVFQKSSFFFDVREAALKGRLHEKQKKLLHDLKGKTANFDNMDEGKEILKSCLESVSLLIILDDVDHKDQLDALLPARDKLGHESLIIVTTRDMQVLRACDISTIYEMRPLNSSYAEELFCWHAFGQPTPFTDFKELAKKFINACSGLPLSLKVLGSLVHGEWNKDYWQSQLDKLSRIVLPNDIKSRLKISYDALDKEEKEMFLDVACFFIGWRRSSATAVWDESQWSGLHGFQRLVNKCLVELNKDNTIRMHDHLRDLGREIANQQSPYRLWSERQIIQIHPEQQTIRIRGMADAFGDNCYVQNGKIILNTTQGERILAPRSLGLKIFIGQVDFINEECSELSRELVCFRCNGFAHKKFPSWFQLEKLRLLQLDTCGLEDLWEGDEDAPVQLRQLLIAGSDGLKNISGLQKLRSLETLRIYDCIELKTLPSLREATSLKEIDLKSCYELEKIESLEGLRSLETLTIHWCSLSKTLPSLREATSLREIDLQWCKKLEKIESLEGLRSLETLRIKYCEELKTLPSLREATSLKEIDLQWCDKLEKIESLEGLTSLETLTLHCCTELKTLPSLGGLTSLEQFELRECWKLDKVEGLEVLRSLKRLEVHIYSMRPCMLKLAEQSERLKSVEVVANRLVVDEASIREIQKWPREEILCTRAVIDVMSVRNFFTSLIPENAVEHCRSRGGTLRMPESAGNGNAILICFIIHSIHPNPSFAICCQDFEFVFSPKMSNGGEWVELGNFREESIWVWMGIFPQESEWLQSEEYEIDAWWVKEKEEEVQEAEEAEEVEGWLMRGTEQSIREAFHHLSQREHVEWRKEESHQNQEKKWSCEEQTHMTEL